MTRKSKREVERLLANPEDPIPADIAADLPPNHLAAFQEDL